MTCFYSFARQLILLYEKVLCRLDLVGVENVPRDGGLLIACNHLAAADPPLVGAVIPRQLHFMAKKELFRNPVLRWLITSLNAFPVDRFSLDTAALKQGVALLQEGRALLMFPEGTRSKDGNLRQAKPGVGMIARKAGVPVVPVYVSGSRRAWANWLLGRRLAIVIGAPLPAGWIMSQVDAKNGYEAIAGEVMRRIGQLRKSIATGIEDEKLGR